MAIGNAHAVRRALSRRFIDMWAWAFPVFDWFKTNKYAGWIAGAVLLIFLGKWRDNHLETIHRADERRKVDAKWKERIDKANAETQQRIEQARDVAEEIERDLFESGGTYSTHDLNRDQLRKYTENDPNNLGRRLRDT